MSDIPLGTIVEVQQFGRGVIRFSGATQFAQGKWVGIELDDARGKNDGSINGVPYFTCKLGYGVFVRSSQIKATFGSELEAIQRAAPAAPPTPAVPPTPAAPPTPTIATTPRAAAAVGHQQTPSLRRNSVRASSSTIDTARANSPSKTILVASAATRAPINRASQVSPTKRVPALVLQPRKSISHRQPTIVPDSPIVPLSPSPNQRLVLGLPSSLTSASSASSDVDIPTTPAGKLPPGGLGERERERGRGEGRSNVVSVASSIAGSITSAPLVASPLSTRDHSPASTPAYSPVIQAPIPKPTVSSNLTTAEPLQPPLSPTLPNLRALPIRTPQPLAPPALPPQPTIVDDTLQNELAELRTRVRFLETKRGDDQRHIRELEARLVEADTFVTLRPKLKAKISAQETELSDLRRELADARQLSELSDGRVLDGQEQLEMAMLDKEMADERAELAEAELEECKERLARVEVELEFLKTGTGADGISVAAKDALAQAQLEQQNLRLKEALVRLRDISSETDQEQKRRIMEMEKDLVSFDDLQAQYESVLIMLQNAQTEIQDLKQQVDDALESENMLMQLTERNLMLGEKIEEMRITIEDLEALKELTDELEENHVETERMLNEDLEHRDTQIREQANKVAELENLCQEYESTILQFRDFVAQLQGEVESLRSQTETAQSASAQAATQTAAIMSMNLKLQSTASKNQARHVELEVKKIEARETKELLGIVQPYLPQLYIESDSDATSCYLFFQRFALKADVINTVVAQAHGLPDVLGAPATTAGGGAEVLIGVCEMRSQLSNLSTRCKCFASILRRCDVELFLAMGRVYPEIAPMERRLDMHIDLLRRDEFRERECFDDVDKMQTQFKYLTDTYFKNYEHDLGERELGHITSFDYELDSFAAAVGLVKSSLGGILKEDEITVDLGGYDIEVEAFEPLQRLLEQYKIAKTLSKKLITRMDGLVHDSLAIKPRLVPQMLQLSTLMGHLVDFGIRLAQSVMSNISEVRSSKSPFQLTTILGYVKQNASSTIAQDLKPGASVWEAIGEYVTGMIQEASKLLPQMMEAENVSKVTGVAPWTTRVEEVKASLAINIEAERKVAQLTDEMQGLIRTLKSKDQHIQESTVKIELLERKMENVKKQADAIVDLEDELGKARKQERAYEEAMEQLQMDLDQLEQDNEGLRLATAGQERQAAGPQQPETENVAVEGTFETSYLLEQIDTLRGTIRFLQTENSYLKGQDLLREIQALPPLPQARRIIKRDPESEPQRRRRRTRPGSSLSQLNKGSRSISDDDNDADKKEGEEEGGDEGSDNGSHSDAGSHSSSSSSSSSSTTTASGSSTPSSSLSLSSPSHHHAPLTLRALSTETKLLYRDVIRFSSSSRIVDLSELQAKRREAQTTKVWMPLREKPAFKVMERKMEGERLEKRVKGLMQKANLIAGL